LRFHPLVQVADIGADRRTRRDRLNECQDFEIDEVELNLLTFGTDDSHRQVGPGPVDGLLAFMFSAVGDMGRLLVPHIFDDFAPADGGSEDRESEAFEIVRERDVGIIAIGPGTRRRRRDSLDGEFRGDPLEPVAGPGIIPAREKHGRMDGVEVEHAGLNAQLGVGRTNASGVEQVPFAQHREASGDIGHARGSQNH